MFVPSGGTKVSVELVSTSKFRAIDKRENLMMTEG